MVQFAERVKRVAGLFRNLDADFQEEVATSIVGCLLRQSGFNVEHIALPRTGSFGLVVSHSFRHTPEALVVVRVARAGLIERVAVAQDERTGAKLVLVDSNGPQFFVTADPPYPCDDTGAVVVDRDLRTDPFFACRIHPTAFSVACRWVERCLAG
ncbi:MAG: hypothetical protein HY340_01440 [Candidatus Kerfeldbacteria bacterium]|nr:hypothetical protein [Candidatus Kerfeldbacteria bacterium]